MRSRYYVVRNSFTRKYEATNLRSIDEAVAIHDAKLKEGIYTGVFMKGGARSGQLGGVSREDMEAARARNAGKA